MQTDSKSSSNRKPNNSTVLQRHTFPFASLFTRLTFRTIQKTLEKSGFQHYIPTNSMFIVKFLPF